MITQILVNIGVLPVEAPIYNSINKFLVPMAVPLLLFTADLRRVIKDTGTLFVAFCIGAVATLTSTAIAAWVGFPPSAHALPCAHGGRFVVSGPPFSSRR